MRYQNRNLRMALDYSISGRIKGLSCGQQSTNKYYMYSATLYSIYYSHIEIIKTFSKMSYFATEWYRKEINEHS